MKGQAWGRIRPSDIDWQQFPDPHGRPTTPVRILKEGVPYVLEADFPAGYEAGLHWHPFDTIYLVTQGELHFGGEGVYRPGDLRWVEAGHVYGPETAGPEGVRFFLVSLGGPIGLNWADLYPVPDHLAKDGARWGRARAEDVDWEMFDDPAGRPTKPVQVLADGGPYVLRSRFEPGGSVGEHWHDYDTLYFIERGRMRFGEEGWYEAGDVRWITGGQSYGPEEAGAEGVEFVLVSCGGPVNLALGRPRACPAG